MGDRMKGNPLYDRLSAAIANSLVRHPDYWIGLEVGYKKGVGDALLVMRDELDDNTLSTEADTKDRRAPEDVQEGAGSSPALREVAE